MFVYSFSTRAKESRRQSESFALFVAYAFASSLNQNLPLKRKSGRWSGYEVAIPAILACGIQIGITMAVQNGMKQLGFPRKRRHSSAGRAADL
jgi:hypothetical protein